MDDDNGGMTYGSPYAHDPLVILRILDQRGIRLEGLAPEKLRLRLRLCVKQGILSKPQSAILQEHLQDG